MRKIKVLFMCFGISAGLVAAENLDSQAAQQLQLLRELQQQALSGQSKGNEADPSELLNNLKQGGHALDNQNQINSVNRQAPNMVSPAPTQERVSANEMAFENMASQLLPLTPEQIIRLNRMYSASKAAAVTSPGTPPQPMATTQLVQLSPGATPPVVRLAQGFVTSVVFLDSTGAPWPIQDYDIGDPKSFNVVWNRKDNTLMIQAQDPYRYGNLAVRLVHLNTPLMVTLIPGQSAVDYRVDMRVQSAGPNAYPVSNQDAMPNVSDTELLGVLSGVPPQGAQPLSLDGGEGQVWVHGDVLYLRTPYRLLSPGWLASMSSPDGTHVYKLKVSPMLLVSRGGRSIHLRVKGL